MFSFDIVPTQFQVRLSSFPNLDLSNSLQECSKEKYNLPISLKKGQVFSYRDQVSHPSSRPLAVYCTYSRLSSPLPGDGGSTPHCLALRCCSSTCSDSNYRDQNLAVDPFILSMRMIISLLYFVDSVSFQLKALRHFIRSCSS